MADQLVYDGSHWTEGSKTHLVFFDFPNMRLEVHSDDFLAFTRERLFLLFVQQHFDGTTKIPVKPIDDEQRNNWIAECVPTSVNTTTKVKNFKWVLNPSTEMRIAVYNHLVESPEAWSRAVPAKMGQLEMQYYKRHVWVFPLERLMEVANMAPGGWKSTIK